MASSLDQLRTAVVANRSRYRRGFGAADPPPPGGGDPPPGSSQTVAFTEDTTTDFLNPERGWMDRKPRTDARFANARTSDGQAAYAVMWGETGGTPWNGTSGNPFRWDNYKTQNLPQSLLDELATTFAAARTAGIKMKVRFVYSYTLDADPSDTTQAWMQTHIAQVAPILNANRDTIIQVDAGLIAAFGEWAVYVRNGVVTSDLAPGSTSWWTEPWVSARRAVLQTWLDELHPDIMLGLRTPRGDNGYRSFFDGGGGRTNWATHDHEANAFDGSDISRVGFYMDCLWTNESHGDTFDYYTPANTTPDLNAAAAGGRIAPVTGETCDLGGLNSHNDGSLVLGTGPKSGRTLGVDVLYRKFWDSMYAKWISEGTYPAISRSLGYRLVLREMDLPATLAPGASGNVRIEISNVGFGKVYNRRPIDLVFTGPGGSFPVRLTADARGDLPLAGETTETTYPFTLPAGLSPTGTYALSLALPDPDPLDRGLALDPRYSIRLANSDVTWSSITGHNALGANATILSGLAGVGSTSTSLTDFPRVERTTVGNRYVDASAPAGGDGSFANPYNTLAAGLAALQSGWTLLVRGGTYAITAQINRNTNWASLTRIMAYGNERPVIDAAGIPANANAIRFGSSSRNELWHGFHVKNVPYNGGGSNYDGQAVAANGARFLTLSDMWVSHSRQDGIWFYACEDCNVLDCAVWRLGDGTTPNDTNSADCYAATGVSTRINFVRCFAGNAGDDGFDFWTCTYGQFIDCVSYKAGYYWNDNPAGDGNGYKMGGGAGGGYNTVKGSLALLCAAHGFDDNDSSVGNNTFRNDTAYGCGNYGFQLGSRTDTVARSNLSLANTGNAAWSGNSPDWREWATPGPSDTFNSWNVGVTLANVAIADVSERDLSLLAASAALGAGEGGAHLGASTIALAIALDWCNRDLT